MDRSPKLYQAELTMNRAKDDLMRVIHLSQSDMNGGAARAAYRIHHCLREAGVDSRMWVYQASTGDWTVEVPANRWQRRLDALRRRLATQVTKRLTTGNPSIHSPALLNTHWVKSVNASDADLVHLHWVNYEMLSISDIGRINKPIVWTLHDMWAFCGAEHYTDDVRWRDGYRRDNRPPYEAGFDLNRWTWWRKRKHWQRPMHIVTPSQWLMHCARESILLRDWPVVEIAYPIDLETWAPTDQHLARTLLGLPHDIPLMLFGAIGGGRDPRKGFDLLLSALENLRDNKKLGDLELVVFGQKAPKSPPEIGFPIHYAGHLSDDLSLRILYNAADVMLVPSRQDNLPLTAIEAQACGVPVVCFGNSGLTSIVEHGSTGYVAQAFDTYDLAHGIKWVLEKGRAKTLRSQSREAAIKKFSCQQVSNQYLKIYRAAIDAKIQS